MLKILGKIASPTVPNNNTSYGSRNDEDVFTGFELVGSFRLDRASIGHFTIYVEDAVYPLDSSIDINSKVSALPHEISNELKGYWVCFLKF